jgi:hypothetical protein
MMNAKEWGGNVAAAKKGEKNQQKRKLKKNQLRKFFFGEVRALK